MVATPVNEQLIDRLARIFVVSRAIGSLELIRNFDRLSGTALSTQPRPLDRMIDEATGRLAADFQRFRRFAEDALWDRAPAEVRAEIRGFVISAITEPAIPKASGQPAH